MKLFHFAFEALFLRSKRPVSRRVLQSLVFFILLVKTKPGGKFSVMTGMVERNQEAGPAIHEVLPF